MSSRPEQLKSTKSYIWYTGHVLGTGATSNVYIGRHKKTGEQVAVKTFNSASYSRPLDVQVRELQVIRKLKHRNIVHLLAIEDDQITKQPVIVMELCMGGSLYSILEEPQNIFGLKEKEFLIVLRDVTSGMKYLRESNVVHRDLKPGNIMRVVDADNTSIYKLADFGAARELQEGGEFMSLYGTEEYLHPDMYQRAVLKIFNQGAYTAKIDLWSVGVTFYHVATGQLPFRPFGGRKNRETMIQLTTKKPYGVISGVQHNSPLGEIEWFSHLPETCHLPGPMRKLIKQLLVGLLECNIDKMYSFDTFFTMVQNILSLKKVHVFNTVTSQIISVYMPPRSDWNEFVAKVAEETKITSSQQLLCYNGKDLDSSTLFTESREYCETTYKNPIILFRRDLKKFPLPIQPARPKLPKIATPYSLENDAPLAKICCGSMYYFLNVVESYLEMQSLMSVSVQWFCNILESRIRENELNLEKLKNEQLNFEETMTFTLCNLDPELLEMIPVQLADESVQEVYHRASAVKTELEMLKQDYQREILNQLRDVLGEFKSLSRKIIRDKVLEKSYDDRQKCQKEQLCYDSFEVLVNGTKTICDQFKDDKRAKRLAYNEEQIHKMDKQKLSLLCTQGMSQLKDHCETRWIEQHNILGSWYTKAFFDYQSDMILAEKIKQMFAKFFIFNPRLEELKRQQKTVSDDIRFQMRSVLQVVGRPNVGPTIIQSGSSYRGNRNALVPTNQWKLLQMSQNEMNTLKKEVHDGVTELKKIRFE
ncbi:serine/threonine-protein kinase TBK1-like [Antedon mediterranea]|uniref:serine/threonine-protein kinase TBK1-like n=1 Tax=Antedon mediterranea TaxID=105859 RepID=UPI003AF9F7AC